MSFTTGGGGGMVVLVTMLTALEEAQRPRGSSPAAHALACPVTGRDSNPFGYEQPEGKQAQAASEPESRPW